MFAGTILLIAALTEEKSNVWVDQDIKRKVKTCTATRISHIGLNSIHNIPINPVTLRVAECKLFLMNKICTMISLLVYKFIHRFY